MLWVWQLTTFVPESWPLALVLISAWFSGWALVTPVWVWWNRSIYRRRHRRTTPMVRPVDFSHDALGREVVASPEVRLNPAAVVVALARDGAAKRYEVVPLALGGPADPGAGIERLPA